MTMLDDEHCGTCPAAVTLPGLSVACPCQEFATRFGTSPPRDRCPAEETTAEMQRRHGHDEDAARTATARALYGLARAIRRAESSAAALEALRREEATTPGARSTTPSVRWRAATARSRDR